MSQVKIDRKWLPLKALRAFDLLTDPQSLSDPAVAVFRSWFIDHFGPHPPNAEQPPHE